MRCIRVCQLPDEYPWPVEPNPPRAADVEVLLWPAEVIAPPGECNAVEVLTCVERRQAELPE
jgi:hypothetical protein